MELPDDIQEMKNLVAQPLERIYQLEVENAKLEATEKQIKAKLLASETVHFDEKDSSFQLAG
jgi:hypothetical protein